MDLYQAFRNPAVGNLILLATAIIGVVGSFLLDRYRRSKRRTHLRQALLAEMRNMVPILGPIHAQQDVVTQYPIDPSQFLVNSVYRSTAEDLGLLSDDEVEAVVDFYSTAQSIQETVGDRNEILYDQVAERELYEKLREAVWTVEEFTEGNQQTKFNHEPIEPDEAFAKL